MFIPLLAGLAGLSLMGNPPKRKRRKARRRNPRGWTWAHAKARAARKGRKGKRRNPTHIDHAAYAAKVRGMSDAALRYTIDDARAAIKAHPEGHKAGYYADEINYCSSELARRKRKNPFRTCEKVYDPRAYPREVNRGRRGYIYRSLRGYELDVEGEYGRFGGPFKTRTHAKGYARKHGIRIID